MREARHIGTVSKRTAATLVALLATAVALLVLASPAKAEVIAVNNANDPGDGTCEQPNGCTLREAIEKANATTQKDGIVFNLPDDSTITLTRGRLVLRNGLTLFGASAKNLTVSGNNSSEVFATASSSNIAIEGLTVTDGEQGIYHYGSTLILDDSTVTGNTAYEGGGIYSSGTLTLNNSTVSGNTASEGGGIYNFGGTLTLNNSTVSGNSAGYGGGIYSRTDGTDSNPDPTGRTTIKNSTIFDNKASYKGGGVFNGEGLVVMEDSIVTKNTAPNNQGAGVASRGASYARTEVKGTTIAGNNGTDVDYVGGGSTNTFKSLGSNKIGDGNAVQAFNQPGDWVGPPTMGALSPRPGSFTRDTTPKVAATVRSGLSNLSRPKIKLYVDGRRKTNFSYNRTTDRLTYTTGRLANKRHPAKIVATDGWGNTKTRSWSFTVDGAKPTVSRLSPKGRTFDRTPTIRATVKDNATNLRKSNIKLYVNGKRKKNFKYNVRRDRLSYNSARLSYKRHGVKILAKDTAGNVSVKSWRFKVEKR